ncbi:MAG: Mur ligase family protein [Candidatus Dependentiae bacterium]|nr:Mur ligase family protein [Candidatus Dependentiae bacterium]
MKNTTPKSATTENKFITGSQRTYNEIVELFDSLWTTNLNDSTLSTMKKLDKAFGNVSQQVSTVLIAGSNGKSLTTHFAKRLLHEEGLIVGSFFSPHILTYNERFTLNNDIISNKVFTELANDVINTAESLAIPANTFELLTMMALLYFKNNNVDVALMEVGKNGPTDATTICSPKIAAITRITEATETEQATYALIKEALSIVKPGTHVVSADQSKLNLQAMQTMAEEMGGIWSMPIRKLAPLQYPFEQLHGRCAALAERIAYLFINSLDTLNEQALSKSLLAKQKGQRGRPTLEAKRESENNPKKTIEQFWKETLATMPGHFQLLDKEKPSILLDNASNIDALSNLLLGIRLLHYQRPLKGLTLILGRDNKDLDLPELLKLLRYFFKKTSGQVIVYPVTSDTQSTTASSADIEKITNAIKTMKIKTKSAKTFGEAFEAAQKTVDERHGLVVITGSSDAISEYWKHKGIKKF